MEALKPRIEEWQRRLADWQRRFDDEYAALARKRCGLFGRLSPEQAREVADLALEAAGKDVAVELHAFVSELCDAYLAEKLPQPRAKLRAWVGNEGETLFAVWSYAEQALGSVQGPDDVLTLRRGLAALSIHDLRGDYSEVVEQLGRAWLAAFKAGIDPKPHFEAVAALSNPGMGGGGACFGQLMAEFGASAYFRDRVRPQLGRRSA